MKSVLGCALALVIGLGIAVSPADAAGKKAKKAKKKVDQSAVLFKKLDTNSDTKLSETEFSKLADAKKKDNPKKPGKVAKKPGKAAKKSSALFAKVDTNKDGSVSLDEFKKLKEAKGDKKKKKKSK